jgi:hypothetical protein
MTRDSCCATLILIYTVLGGFAAPVWSEPMRIGFIEFFGNSHLSDAQLRPHLAFREGDVVSLDDDDWQKSFLQSQRQLSRVAGVSRAYVGGPLCCTNGELTVYIGIEEAGVRRLRFSKAPRGKVRLPAEIVASAVEFPDAQFAAIARGENGEDRTAGHALSHAPEQRQMQLQFVEYSRRHFSVLRNVLRECAEPAERALAAQILGYADDKRAVVPDLVRATRDSSPEVRNDAMRALLVFTKKVATNSAPVPEVPYDPFVSLLASPIWTDRNKSSWAVESLARSRDPKLLDLLRRKSLAPLAEMARWRIPGHGDAARIILGRIGGCGEDEIAEAIASGGHEDLIAAAMRSAISGESTSNVGLLSCSY